jgi:hypothetical protein
MEYRAQELKKHLTERTTYPRKIIKYEDEPIGDSM